MRIKMNEFSDLANRIILEELNILLKDKTILEIEGNLKDGIYFLLNNNTKIKISSKNQGLEIELIKQNKILVIKE